MRLMIGVLSQRTPPTRLVTGVLALVRRKIDVRTKIPPLTLARSRLVPGRGQQNALRRKTAMSSNNGSNVNKTSLQTRIRGLVAGTQKHAANGQVSFGSKSYDAATLVKLFQSLADALDAADAARVRWQDALESVRGLRSSVLPIVQGYREWVAVTYAGTPSLLADYGVPPRKVRAPLTAEQKAAAALKRKATRAARGTLGSKQKKGVKGDVAGIEVAPLISTVSKPGVAAPGAPTAPATSGGATSAAATQVPGK
jgi:hypothetical protein